MEIKFGPAGNAQSFADAGFKATVDAPRWLHEMGLNAYEYQCGRGVNIGEETARKIAAQAALHDISMSLHAPYYINLSNRDEERVQKNIGYVLASCQAATWLGADRIVVHTGGVGKQSRTKAFENTKKNVRDILNSVEQAGYTTTICLETMGKQSVIGSAEEIFELVALDDRLLPCIDFGHLNARTCGKCSTEEEFAQVLDLMENTIGTERARVFHSHFSHIEYGPKGEVRHLTFADEQYGPDFAPLAKLIAQRGWTPRFICESAGTQAEDAKQMMDMYLASQNV
ncbi:TIM barrel protein [Butyricicoccus pullicaecorum]|uniref:Endonuclease IV n=1 Tax=Butyricicoccus pullicaecorum TaxID=501571 RepID=A0A1Y4LYQ6_9FIRM|nr:TIM barrel protein [Butyricicoccus pullicaecorum]OUP59512.1 endonuclease IV [Butyricicoccus pullicaecorum]